MSPIYYRLQVTIVVQTKLLLARLRSSASSPSIAHVNIARHEQWRRSRTNRPNLLRLQTLRTFTSQKPINLLSMNYLRLCETKSTLFLMIVMLLIDFYSDDDIASAKNILFQTAFNDRDAPRLIKRKGKDKSLNNIQDILNIFLEWLSNKIVHVNGTCLDK